MYTIQNNEFRTYKFGFVQSLVLGIKKFKKRSILSQCFKNMLIIYVKLLKLIFNIFIVLKIYNY